jgi:hypothetical protein
MRVRLLQLAALLALVGLGCMVWSMLDPAPIPVIVAMSAGQGVGTLSFALFVLVVALDLRKRR